MGHLPAQHARAALRPRHRRGPRWLGHTGELPGYNTGAYYLPANKAVIVVMVNSDIPVGKTNPMPLIFKALTKVVTPGNVPQ